MTEVDRFADIRPYRDDEVPAAIERLIQDDEFIGAIAKYRFGSLMSWLGWAIRPLIRQFLRHKWAKVSTIHQVQMGVTRYMSRMIATSTQGVSFSGLEHLKKEQGYLFVVIGIGVSELMNAIGQFAMSTQSLVHLTSLYLWNMGNFVGQGYGTVVPVGILILLICPWVVYLSRALGVLRLGPVTASTFGCAPVI